MRKFFSAVFALAMLMVGLHGPASAAGAPLVGKLMAGSFVFWDGGKVGALN